MSERMVVIGGGAAGMSAASAARRTDPSLDVVVLEATSYIAYGLCGLPYYLSGVVATADDLFAYPMERFTKDRGIDVRTAAVATELDPDGRWIVYRQGERTHRLSYSSLVVTAGASPVHVAVPDIGADRTFAVRTLEEAIALRGLLDAGKVGSALVVGAGYIGLEMAEALVARGCSVTVVERLDQVLPTLDTEVAAVVEEHVRQHVDLRLGTDATAPGLPAVDLAVVSVGVRPCRHARRRRGCATPAPRARCSSTRRCARRCPDVWAAGDCIAPLHRVTGQPAYVPLGTTANKTGRVAGTVAAGGSASFAGIVGTAVVKVFDLEVARTGITLAEARAAGIEAVATDVVHRSRAKYYPGGSALHVRLVHGAGGRLLGAQMVGREGAAQRIDVLATALQTGMTVGDLTALDLAYAPPYSPVYDPILIAAESAARRVEAS